MIAIIIIPDIIFFVLKLTYISDVVNTAVGFFLGPVSAVYMYLVYVGFKATKGPITVKTGAGRKAKYIVLSLLGFIIPIMLLGGSVLLLMFVTAGSKPLPNSTYTQPPSLEKSVVPIDQQNLYQK
jgi:hypothetical protein